MQNTNFSPFWIPGHMEADMPKNNIILSRNSDFFFQNIFIRTSIQCLNMEDQPEIFIQTGI